MAHHIESHFQLVACYPKIGWGNDGSPKLLHSAFQIIPPASSCYGVIFLNENTRKQWFLDLATLTFGDFFDAIKVRLAFRAI